jgi:AcrR family transcriptional regulator
MSPRARKVSDEEVFAAAGRVMTERGPAQWTLADIATAAGLTAGALVQRFGSKHALQVALAESWANSIPELFKALRQGRSSPLEALRAYAQCVAQMGQSPGTLAHHLAYLQLDLTDADLYRHVRAGASATRAELRKLIDLAIVAGELVESVDAPALARALEVAVSGSLLTSAFYQDGPATKSVLADVQAVLTPYLKPAAQMKGRRQTTTTPARDRGRLSADQRRARQRKRSERG